MKRGLLVAWLVACSGSQHLGDDVPDAAGQWEPPIGAHYDPDGSGVVFRIASSRATRVELWIYDAPMGAERSRIVMEREAGDIWRARVATGELPETIYYGYRVWGPNWTFDAAWTPGSMVGFVTDVDSDGNRMNPNKLVFDPYARELSHDPTTPEQPDGSYYGTGQNRTKDSGPVAPKVKLFPSAVLTTFLRRTPLVPESSASTETDQPLPSCQV